MILYALSKKVEAYSIIMTTRSPDLILQLFERKGVVTLAEIQKVLNNASRPTTFRYLRQVPYLRSYNHNGRYYTHQDPTLFDRYGLYSLGETHFSRDGTLGKTVKRLIRESQAGLTHREMVDLLHVRVQVLLLEAVRQNQIRRVKVAHLYLYLHANSAIGERQLQKRQQQIASQQAGEEDEVTSEVIIQVLLGLIRHPGSNPVEVVRLLRGHSPPITRVQVEAVYARFDLGAIGKKGGATIY